MISHNYFFYEVPYVIYIVTFITPVNRFCILHSHKEYFYSSNNIYFYYKNKNLYNMNFYKHAYLHIVL